MNSIMSKVSPTPNVFIHVASLRRLSVIRSVPQIDLSWGAITQALAQLLFYSRIMDLL